MRLNGCGLEPCRYKNTHLTLPIGIAHTHPGEWSGWVGEWVWCVYGSVFFVCLWQGESHIGEWEKQKVSFWWLKKLRANLYSSVHDIVIYYISHRTGHVTSSMFDILPIPTHGPSWAQDLMATLTCPWHHPIRMASGYENFQFPLTYYLVQEEKK